MKLNTEDRDANSVSVEIQNDGYTLFDVLETYAYLMKENKPLDSEYEKALYLNRWNLYVRS
jgi:DNA-directed RNA polymerase subunit L